MKPDPTSLDLLHDVVAPPRAPWWPPAPGWYWVMGFAGIVLLVLLVRGLIRWQRNRYRREALAELARQERALRDPAQRAVVLAALAVLLKRAALSAFPRPQVASLTGAGWFEFLDRTGRTAGFASGHGTILEGAVYDPRTADAVDDAKARELVALVRHWLAHHRAEPAQKGGG